MASTTANFFASLREFGTRFDNDCHGLRAELELGCPEEKLATPLVPLGQLQSRLDGLTQQAKIMLEARGPGLLAAVNQQAALAADQQVFVQALLARLSDYGYVSHAGAEISAETIPISEPALSIEEPCAESPVAVVQGKSGVLTPKTPFANRLQHPVPQTVTKASTAAVPPCPGTPTLESMGISKYALAALDSSPTQPNGGVGWARATPVSSKLATPAAGNRVSMGASTTRIIAADVDPLDITAYGISKLAWQPSPPKSPPPIPATPNLQTPNFSRTNASDTTKQTMAYTMPSNPLQNKCFQPVTPQEYEGMDLDSYRKSKMPLDVLNIHLDNICQCVQVSSSGETSPFEVYFCLEQLRDEMELGDMASLVILALMKLRRLRTYVNSSEKTATTYYCFSAEF